MQAPTTVGACVLWGVKVRQRAGLSLVLAVFAALHASNVSSSELDPTVGAVYQAWFVEPAFPPEALPSGLSQAEQWIAAACVERYMAAEVPECSISAATIRRHVLAAWNARQLAEQAVVTDDEVRAAYDENPSAWEIPARIKFDYLFAPADVEVNGESHRQLLDLFHQRLTVGGEDFVTLRDEARRAGILVSSEARVMQPGRMAPDIDELLFGPAQPGVRAVARTQHGWHLFVVHDFSAASRTTFEDARQAIALRLRREKLTVLFQEYSDRLEVEFPEIPSDADEDATMVGGVRIDAEAIASMRALLPDMIQATTAEQMLRERAVREARMALDAERNGANEQDWVLRSTQLLENHHRVRAAMKVFFENWQPNDAALRGDFLALETPLVKERETEVIEYRVTMDQSVEEMTARGQSEARARLMATVSTLRDSIARGCKPGEVPNLTITNLGWAPTGPRGRVLDMATRNLTEPGFSEVLVDRESLVFFEVRGIHPARPMTYEEAKPILVVMARELAVQAWVGQFVEKCVEE